MSEKKMVMQVKEFKAPVDVNKWLLDPIEVKVIDIKYAVTDSGWSRILVVYEVEE